MHKKMFPMKERMKNKVILISDLNHKLAEVPGIARENFFFMLQKKYFWKKNLSIFLKMSNFIYPMLPLGYQGFLQQISAHSVQREEEGQPQQLLARATFSSFWRL